MGHVRVHPTYILFNPARKLFDIFQKPPLAVLKGKKLFYPLELDLDGMEMLILSGNSIRL
jgi:hypothetical protein